MAFQRKKPAAIGVQAPFPGFIEPSLASPIEKVPSGSRWIHEINVQPDVASLLPQLLWHMDEPIADAAFITTYLVSKFARQACSTMSSSEPDGRPTFG